MQLGFLCFEARDHAAWEVFLGDVLGLAPVEGGRWRMDGHAWRFELTEGQKNDLCTVGWEFDDDELDAVLGRLRSAGIDVVEADPDTRGVRRLYRLVDPAGIPTELYSGPRLADSPFESDRVPGGFVADELGLGHAVLTTRSKEESVRFYTEMFGVKLSDHIVCEVYGHPVDISFFHANARHHSVAFGGPQRKRLHHFMVEARDLDQVGYAHDRALKAGLTIMQTPGRHPNDRMLSFYAKTPSGFQFEFGWGGRLVDDASWETTTYDRISDWGHHPPQIVYRSEKR